jgi:hypothetical protein
MSCYELIYIDTEEQMTDVIKLPNNRSGVNLKLAITLA